MSAQIKARHLHPNPHLKMLKNVNIMVLDGIDHCYSLHLELCLSKFSNNKGGKGK